MTDAPKPARRTRRAASSTDPKTYTESQAQTLIDKAIASEANRVQELATRETVKQLSSKFDALQGSAADIKRAVERGNAIKEQIEPFEYQNWSLEEKRALRSSVVDFLSRLHTRVFMTSKWKRRTTVLGGVLGVLTLLLTAFSALYAAMHR